MSDRDPLFDQVARAIAEALNLDGATLTPATSLLVDLGVDSVDFLDISFEIEKNTGCEVVFADMLKDLSGAGASRPTIADVMHYIHQKRP